MSIKPILFSGPMVRALLAGTKTQTRRTLKPQPELQGNGLYHVRGGGGGVVNVAEGDIGATAVDYLRIALGDRLWVRETWTLHDRAADVGIVAYAATFTSHGWTETTEQVPRGLTLSTRTQPVQRGWRPSIHMPRWASRLTLTVTDVRVERLQDISEADAKAEGCEATTCANVLAPNDGFPSFRSAYAILWDSINGPGSWEANPWVAAYTFTVHRGNVDALGEAA